MIKLSKMKRKTSYHTALSFLSLSNRIGLAVIRTEEQSYEYVRKVYNLTHEERKQVIP